MKSHYFEVCMYMYSLMYNFTSTINLRRFFFFLLVIYNAYEIGILETFLVRRCSKRAIVSVDCCLPFAIKKEKKSISVRTSAMAVRRADYGFLKSEFFM